MQNAEQNDLRFSNVQKPLTILGKPDDHAIDIIFVKTINMANRTGIVYHDDTKEITKISVTTERVGDRLSDGGIVTHITKSDGQRVYATMRLTVDEILEKFGDKFNVLTWANRTKKRKPKDADDTAEVG